MFASLPALFAVHQLIEGFVWLGLDGILSPAVTHNAGAAFMLYAQGLLPLLMPLSIYLFEPPGARRKAMLPFVVIGGGLTLYILWALTAFSTQISVQQNSIVYVNAATNNDYVAVLYIIATCGSLFFSKSEGDGALRRGEHPHPAGGNGGEALRVHVAVVRVCGRGERDYPGLFLEECRGEAV